MAFTVGTIQLNKVVRKQWEDRVYYKCVGVGADKEIYSVSLNGDFVPVVGDVLHMIVEPSEKDWKPAVKFQREK